MKTYFAAVVHSGSTCNCRALAHQSENCGHKHRTENGAQRCLDKLQGYKDGNCSATWYGGKVVEMDRATESEVSMDWDEHKKVCAYDLCRCWGYR